MRTTYVVLLLLGVAPLIGAGCETSQTMFKSMEQMLGTGDHGRILADIKEAAARGDAETLGQELLRLRADFDQLLATLKDKVTERWGQQEVKVPSRTQYVKYTQNYDTRAVTDFDQGTVLVETVDDKDPKESLKRAIVATLLTTSDPRAVDLFSDESVTLTSGSEAYLLGLVLDQEGQALRTPEQAERFATYLVDTRTRARSIQTASGAKIARYVEITMVPNFEHKQAEKYRPVVSRFAQQYQISPSLIFAIIQTESSFNPFAVSPVPAYGLMQLVPTSGGRDAYLRAKGVDEIPSPEYLFDPENNIELGSAYLNVLAFSYLAQVADPVSREYCVIAAYNTGSGNVLGTFAQDSTAAFAAINLLEPGTLYDKLYTSLPYEETRQYLGKVITYRREFVSGPALAP